MIKNESIHFVHKLYILHITKFRNYPVPFQAVTN